MSAVTLVATLAALAALGFVWIGGRALRHRRVVGGSGSLLLGALLLSLAALAATVSVGTRGYRAFTREVTAAVVTVAPNAPRRFAARFRFPDGREQVYRLAGDELYVDARVLKWKPLGNLLGLHTDYELDRVAGRYADLASERTGERTVHSLGQPKPVDLFHLRRRFSLLRPLVDAEYGSATFITVTRPTTFLIRVSTSGLLIRRADGAMP
ncbi:MAG TPA: hypothetical protein VD707_07060 [Gemmatimonadales bacterium]|nr:hypothetical protein [Gemmatimonadales bacterium]